MPPLPVVTWNAPLHRQAHTAESARKKGLEGQRFVCWFALSPGYGENYGHIKRVYEPTRPLRLLDLSTMAMRTQIAAELALSLAKLSPDEQYSGGAGNHAIHALLHPLLIKHSLDGTIIEERRADSDCEGATEIVLQGSCVRYVQRVFEPL